MVGAKSDGCDFNLMALICLKNACLQIFLSWSIKVKFEVHQTPESWVKIVKVQQLFRLRACLMQDDVALLTVEPVGCYVWDLVKWLLTQ